MSNSKSFTIYPWEPKDAKKESHAIAGSLGRERMKRKLAAIDKADRDEEQGRTMSDSQVLLLLGVVLEKYPEARRDLIAAIEAFENGKL